MTTRSPKRGNPPRPHPEALGHLAAAMAHEVRNPLNTMALHIELLEGRLAGLPAPEREAARRSLDSLRSELERVDATLAQYLRHVGPPDLPREATQVERLLAEAAERAAPEAAARRVHLSVECGPLTWSFDAGAVARALDELVENAVEASPRGGTVILRAAATDDVGRIEIVDEGDGLPPGELPRLFGLGFTTRRGRAGLGLAVAKQIVKGHGGSLSLRPNSPRGTIATIDLPLD